jgi:hypothetical protein
MHFIDRRLNPGAKSLENRQRFLRRAKTLVREAVRKTSQDRNVKDVLEGGERYAFRSTAWASRVSIAGAAASATWCCRETPNTSRATICRAAIKAVAARIIREPRKARRRTPSGSC